MAELFNIDHEAGDLSEYDSTVTDGGNLSAHADAALAGTSYGLNCFIDDTTEIYGECNLGTSNTSGVLRARFYIDPNTIDLSANQKISVCRFFASTANAVVHVRMEGRSGSFRYQIGAWDDTPTYSYTQSDDLSDAEHYVELQLLRASSDVAADGQLDAWVDGGALTSVTDLDNYDRFADFDYVRLGAMEIHSSADGTFYLDQLIVNDDGSEIGPVAAGGLSIPVAQHHYRHKVFG
jgi:hypothetical protein